MKLYSEEHVAGWMKCMVAWVFCNDDQTLECPKFEAGKDDKSAEFRKKSPFGIYPMLESNDGRLFSSNSICRYFARNSKSLYDGTDIEQCEIDSFLDTNTMHFEVPLASYQKVLKVLGNGHCGKISSAEIEKKVLADVDSYLQNLDSHVLAKKPYVVNKLSVADVVIAASIKYFLDSPFSGLLSAPSIFERKHDLESFLKKYNNVNKWYKSIINTPTWSKAMERITGEKKGKAVNELDLLAPSSMDLNEWKRRYSNTKDLYGVAMKWFWENFDSQGYSIYYMRYEKMEGECTVGYVTANQVGGFFQRLDPNFRKYSFGVIDVVGESGNFDIIGVWMFRGQDIPSMMKDHVSFEYHNFKKLDPIKNVDDKKLVEDYWCACENVEGRPISDSKVWK